VRSRTLPPLGLSSFAFFQSSFVRAPFYLHEVVRRRFFKARYHPLPAGPAFLRRLFAPIRRGMETLLIAKFLFRAFSVAGLEGSLSEGFFRQPANLPQTFEQGRLFPFP